jgi:phosphoribosyl 1,2-cyclic phosphate phosphodiesterase
MELLLLGTAAAEGWPAPFCECPNCQKARRRGGPNLRSRSGALLDDNFKIDFNADTLLHMQRASRSLASLKTLVFTHQHSDHFMPRELHWVCPPYSQTPPAQPIAIYANAPIISTLRENPVLPQGDNEYFALHQMEPFQSVTTDEGDEVLPLPADHVEGAFVLRIKREGKTIFYGHDSGLYPPETLEALSDGTPLDIALLDCTCGGLKTGNRGHMDTEGVTQMAQELRQRGAITEKTRVVATHFSHNGGLLHEELVQAFSPHKIEVAFDGMTIEV